MTYTYARRVANCAKIDTRENLDECIAKAKAESNKSAAGEMFYAWNRVLHALWDVQKRLDVVK